jgi:hypothetical protein
MEQTYWRRGCVFSGLLFCWVQCDTIVQKTRARHVALTLGYKQGFCYKSLPTTEHDVNYNTMCNWKVRLFVFFGRELFFTSFLCDRMNESCWEERTLLLAASVLLTIFKWKALHEWYRCLSTALAVKRSAVDYVQAGLNPRPRSGAGKWASLP